MSVVPQKTILLYCQIDANADRTFRSKIILYF